MSESPTPQPPIGEREPWGRVGWAVVAATFLLGFVNFPLEIVSWKFDHFPGGCDNRLNNFILEHGYRYVTGRVESFWDAPSFYPQRGATAWSDAHIGMLPLYTAVRTLGGSPEQGYQAHFLACFVLNFVAAVWALRRLGFRSVGTAAGAFVFTFALPLVGQTAHTQLFPRFLVPPAVVFAWEFLQFPRLRLWAGLAFCVAGQLYLTVYIGLLLVLLLAAGLLVSLVRFRNALPWGELRRPSGRESAKRIGVVAVAALAILPLLRHAGGGAGTQHAWIRHVAPTPSSWLTVPNVALMSPSQKWSPLPAMDEREGEQSLMMGLVPLAAVVGIALLGFRAVRIATPRGIAVAAAWTVLLVVTIVTRLGPVWIYEPFLYLPGVSGIRSIGRVVLVLLFPAGIAVAYAIDSTVELVRRAGVASVAFATLVLLGLVTVEQRIVSVENTDLDWSEYRSSLAVSKAWQARISAAIARHPNPKLVYVFPTAGWGRMTWMSIQTETMRASQDAGLPCVNGWTGNFPANWNYFSGYRSLMWWLLEVNQTPAEQIDGLVVIAWPVPDIDPVYETLMWTLFPPRLLDE